MFNDFNDFNVSLVALLVAILFYSFKIGGSWISSFFGPGQGSSNHNNKQVFLERIMGFGWLGPFLFVVLAWLGEGKTHLAGLGTLGSAKVWVISAILATVIMIINYYNAPRESNLIMYPQIRTPVWSRSLVFTSALSWILYLLAYEYAFRGILFFACLTYLPANAAITINVVIYSLFHIQKGAKEAFASIPFGIVLCYLVLESNSIWPPVFLHIVLALSNEWFSLYFNPDISVKRSGI